MRGTCFIVWTWSIRIELARKARTYWFIFLEGAGKKDDGKKRKGKSGEKRQRCNGGGGEVVASGNKWDQIRTGQLMNMRVHVLCCTLSATMMQFYDIYI